jgi:hypothetical protein
LSTDSTPGESNDDKNRDALVLVSEQHSRGVERRREPFTGRWVGACPVGQDGRELFPGGSAVRRRTRTAIATAVLVASLAALTACGGRSPDGGNPGNPAEDTTTTTAATVAGG